MRSNSWVWVSFWREENVMELDSGGGCTTLEIDWNSWITFFERVKFMVCEFYTYIWLLWKCTPKLSLTCSYLNFKLMFNSFAYSNLQARLLLLSCSRLFTEGREKGKKYCLLIWLHCRLPGPPWLAVTFVLAHCLQGWYRQGSVQ